jgi:hypothetical protein
MNTCTIILKRVSTGKQALSMVTRQKDETAVHAYAEAAIAQSPDLRVAEIHTPFMGPGRDHRALHLISRYGRELT